MPGPGEAELCDLCARSQELSVEENGSDAQLSWREGLECGALLPGLGVEGARLRKEGLAVGVACWKDGWG